jgi:hypothetical protein
MRERSSKAVGHLRIRSHEPAAFLAVVCRTGEAVNSSCQTSFSPG